MTELIPELDKLRNKELIFWCIIYQDYLQKYFTVTKVYDEDNIATVESDLHTQLNEVEVIWHPLTAWRIRKLWYDNFTITGSNIIHTMQCIMMDIQAMWLADKTEVERQRHDKRPELKELLIQFSNYL